MCGIVGVLSAYSNGFSIQESDALQYMLAADGLRGDDSTGLFMVEHNGNVHIAKEASNAYTFLARKETTDLLQEVLFRGVFAVGHNRAATRGAVVDKNAHPFWVKDKIVLVQNGTWFGDHKETGHNTEVDSEAVANIIAEEDNIAKALAKINAAYALVWFNVEKKELYMIRNKERPLYVARTSDEGMVFASEPEIIEFGCARALLKLKEKPYLLDDNNLVTITMSGGTWDMENKKMKIKVVAPKQQAIPTVFSQIGQTITRAWLGGGNAAASNVIGVENYYEIHKYVHRCNFKDWHVEDEGLARKYQGEYATKSTAYLEMVDYVQAVPGKDPKAWHCVFTEVEADKDNPGPLFYCTFRDTKEVDILKMIEVPFQITERLGSPVIHVLTDQNTHKKEFITVIKVLEFQNDKEVISDAVVKAGNAYH